MPTFQTNYGLKMGERLGKELFRKHKKLPPVTYPNNEDKEITPLEMVRYWIIIMIIFYACFPVIQFFQ